MLTNIFQFEVTQNANNAVGWFEKLDEVPKLVDITVADRGGGDALPLFHMHIFCNRRAKIE